MVNTQVGIRKNIQALQPNQRKQFFWCLKMLGIIPSFQAIRQRYYVSRGTPGEKNETQPLNKMSPFCLHDELIANHSTCCEHHNFYFGYFHRHLMFHFQMRLNYVDECLRLGIDQFKNKFQEIYFKNPELWRKILIKYRQIAPDKKKVMAHYWNPTNYNNRDDTVIPIELSDPKIYPHQFDEVDELYLLIRESYPYQINVRNRWHNNPAEYDNQRQQFCKQFRPFNHTQETYTEEQKKMIYGCSNPRLAVDLIKFNKEYNHLQDNTMRKVINHRNKTKWSHPNSLDRINLNYMNEGEFQIGFGGRFGSNQKQYNMHYFSEQQCKQSSNLSQKAAKITYNQWIPHYCLGFALLNQDNQDLIRFLESKNAFGFDRSHDLMHVHMKFVMSDALFSDSNLLFFLYHSWIDLQLQLKVRMCHNVIEGHRMYKKLTTPVKRTQRFDILINPDKLQNYFGAYPMLQWANPYIFTDIVGNGNFQNQKQLCKQYGITSDNLIYYFTAQQYIMKSPTQLRTSVFLKQFYQHHYIYKNIDNYKQFKGFANFNAGYDYEIFQTIYDEKNSKLQNKKEMLNDYPNVNIPNYLMEMNNQVNSYYIYIKDKIMKVLNQQKPSKSIKIYEKLITNKLQLLIRFSSSIKNGTHHFYASFQNLVPALLNKNYDISEQEICFLREKTSVLVLPIFGREQDAKNCINCGQSKYKIVNMDQQFYFRYPKLWNFIHSLTLSEVIFDSQMAGLHLPRLINVDTFIDQQQIRHQYQLTYIQGAQEVTLDIIHQSFKLLSVQNFILDLNLAVSKIQNGQVICNVYKQITFDELYLTSSSISQNSRVYRYNCSFYAMRDMNTTLSRNDLDGLVYQSMKGNIMIGQNVANFNFAIEQYHKHIRYTIIIKNIKNQISLKIIDTDYEFKKKIFSTD